MAEAGPLGPATTWAFTSDYNFANVPYTFVMGAAAGRMQLATVATSTSLLGVVITDPDSGQNGTVQFDGITKVRAGGSVTLYDQITTNASGRATAAASGDVVMGMALEAAGADNEIITIWLGRDSGRHPGVV